MFNSESFLRVFDSVTGFLGEATAVLGISMTGLFKATINGEVETAG
jgi:hypothetical protein